MRKTRLPFPNKFQNPSRSRPAAIRRRLQPTPRRAVILSKFPGRTTCNSAHEGGNVVKFRMSLLSVVLVAALVMLVGCGGEKENEMETPASTDPAPAAPETTGSGVPAAISAMFKAEGCCDKAEKAGKACDHQCCQDAVAAGNVCEKCNKA